VEKIVGKRSQGGILQYQIKWSKKSLEESWVSLHHMRDCEQLLKEFDEYKVEGNKREKSKEEGMEQKHNNLLSLEETI